MEAELLDCLLRLRRARLEGVALGLRLERHQLSGAEKFKLQRLGQQRQLRPLGQQPQLRRLVLPQRAHFDLLLERSGLPPLALVDSAPLEATLPLSDRLHLHLLLLHSALPPLRLDLVSLPLGLLPRPLPLEPLPPPPPSEFLPPLPRLELPRLEPLPRRLPLERQLLEQEEEQPQEGSVDSHHRRRRARLDQGEFRELRPLEWEGCKDSRRLPIQVPLRPPRSAVGGFKARVRLAQEGY